MIRKLLLLLFVISINQNTNAQSIEARINDCIQGFVINSSKQTASNSPINDIIISWDFTETANNDKLDLVLEVQPLNACWKGLEASNRSEIRTIKVTDLRENAISQKELHFTDLNSKCIKWKVQIIDKTSDCKIISDWQFTSFL